MNNSNNIAGYWTVNIGGVQYGEFASRAGAARAAKRDGGVVEFVPGVALTATGAAPWS